MGLTDYSEENLLNFWFRGDAVDPPSELYIALFTSAPDDTGGGDEIEGFGYVRQLLTFGAWADGECANDQTVTYPIATGSWGEVTHSAVFDAEEGGNMLVWGELTAPRSVGDGEIFTFGIGSVTAALD